MPRFPFFVSGKACPRCRSRTDRAPTPLLLRPVRWLLRRATWRVCTACGWRGYGTGTR